MLHAAMRVVNQRGEDVLTVTTNTLIARRPTSGSER
jgi:acyl dehydratase